MLLLLAFVSPTLIAMHHSFEKHKHNEVNICHDKIHTTLNNYWSTPMLLPSLYAIRLNFEIFHRIITKFSSKMRTVKIETNSIKNKAPPRLILITK